MSENDEKQIQTYGADYAGAVLQQIIATVGTDPNITMQEIKTRLDELYEQREAEGDSNGITIIERAWGAILQFEKTTGTAIDIAAATRQIAQTMEEQRDMALEQKTKFERDVSSIDTSNPLVESLVKDVRREVHADIEEGGGYFSSCPACDLIEEAALPLIHDQAEIFFTLITSSDISENFEDEVADALRAELATFITNFVHKYNRMLDGHMD